MQRETKVFSYGGGVQSNAALVLAAQGILQYDLFVFANTGDDSENPATLRYVREIAMPYAKAHGIEIIEIAKPGRTLLQQVYHEQRSVSIPARMDGNGAPGNRRCTSDWKVRVIDRYIKELGVEKVTIGIGISLDEFTRMRPDQMEWHDKEPGKTGRKLGFLRRLEYPFIDQRINRVMCQKIIRDAGLPTPPKSACFFCPFKTRAAWTELKREQPELFAQACAMDNHIREVRGTLGKDGVYLHPSLVPLNQAVGDQPLLPGFGEENDLCESGYCFV